MNFVHLFSSMRSVLGGDDGFIHHSMIMLEFAVLFLTLEFNNTLTLEFRLVCYLFVYLFLMICWNSVTPRTE